MTDVPALTASDIAAIQRERLERRERDRLINADAPRVASVRDMRLPRQDGVPCRLYKPAHCDDLPLLVYLHGGGWSFGSLDSHDRFLRQLSVCGRVEILSVGYRLAPEHAYPSARNDVIRIVKGLYEGAILDHADGRPLFLGGDSAGAHIALSAAMRLSRKVLNGLVLFYGAYRPDFTTDSYRANGCGAFGLTTERMRSYWSAYLHAASQAEREEVNLLACDANELPQVYIGAAECDPLLSDSLDLAASLERCGVGHQLQVAKGESHGYLRRLATWAAVHEHLSPVADFIERRSLDLSSSLE